MPGPPRPNDLNDLPPIAGGTSSAPVPSRPIDADNLPLILFDEDLAAIFETSVRTIKRRRALGAWPIPLLPSLDRRNRTARGDVLAFVNREPGARRAAPRPHERRRA